MCIAATKQHFMEKAHGVFIITLLKMLYFFVLIRVHYLIVIRKMIFLGLGEGDISGINGGFDAPEKHSVLVLVKERQNST